MVALGEAPPAAGGLARTVAATNIPLMATSPIVNTQVSASVPVAELVTARSPRSGRTVQFLAWDRGLGMLAVAFGFDPAYLLGDDCPSISEPVQIDSAAPYSPYVEHECV